MIDEDKRNYSIFSSGTSSITCSDRGTAKTQSMVEYMIEQAQLGNKIINVVVPKRKFFDIVFHKIEEITGLTLYRTSRKFEAYGSKIRFLDEKTFKRHFLLDSDITLIDECFDFSNLDINYEDFTNHIIIAAGVMEHQNTQFRDIILEYPEIYNRVRYVL